MKPNLMLKTVTTVLKRNSSKMMIGAGISGMFIAIGTAVKDTPKATKLVEAAREEKGEELTTKEIVQVTWKTYIPTAIISVASAGLIVAATMQESRKHAALVAAYSLLESSAREYHKKVIDTVGEKQEAKIQESIAKDKAAQVSTESDYIFKTGKGEDLVIDATTGRRFESSIDAIKQSIVDLNYVLLNENQVTLNELYYELGLDGTELGDKLCWHIDRGLIEARFSTQLTNDNKPCIVMSFKDLPRPDYLFI